MVDKSTSPLQTHLRPVFGDEAVQTGHEQTPNSSSKEQKKRFAGRRLGPT
jgi:hypothetical protein